MTEAEISSLIEKYHHYTGAHEFIVAAANSLPGKPNNIKGFIEATFRNNTIDDISHKTIKSLITHWNNVANDKLLKGDYQNFIYSTLTVSNLRIVSDYISNQPPY